MKKSLLDDFIKIYYSINCDSEYCNCNECSNKYKCELVGNILKSIREIIITNQQENNTKIIKRC